MTPNAASLSRGPGSGGVGRARLVCEAAPPRPACDKAQPYPSGPRSLPCQALAYECTPRETHTVRLGGSGSPPSPLSAASEPVSSPLLRVCVVVVFLISPVPLRRLVCVAWRVRFLINPSRLSNLEPKPEFLMPDPESLAVHFGTDGIAAHFGAKSHTR